MADYVPNTDGGLLNWLANLKAKLPTYIAALGITPARVTQINTWIDAQTATIQKVAQQKSAWLAASADKATQTTANIGGLRKEVAQWKTNPAMIDAISADLQIIGGGAAFDPNTYKPTIGATAIGDHVRIKFGIGQTDGVNLYWRKKGEATWKFLSRDTNSPYNDHTPLTTPGVPEAREYQAFGVLNDEQIGQPSDIVSATFTG
jgi:hypothetical protein